MILAIHPQTWIEFYNNHSKVSLGAFDLLLHSSICNNKNQIAFSGKWLQFFQEYFIAKSNVKKNYKDIFDATLTELSDNNRIIPVDSKSISNTAELFESFTSSTTMNIMLCVDVNDVPPNSCPDGVAFYKKIKEPNRNWIYFALAAGNEFFDTTLWPNNFKSNQSISVFFEDLISLKNPSDDKIYLQSDYQHFGDIFSLLKGKKIIYHTSGIKLSETQKQAIRQSVKYYFGPNATTKFSTNIKLLHPRLFCYSNVVVKIDNDFNNIDVNSSNWKLTFQYCAKTSCDVKNNLGKFN